MYKMLRVIFIILNMFFRYIFSFLIIIFYFILFIFHLQIFIAGSQFYLVSLLEITRNFRNEVSENFSNCSGDKKLINLINIPQT